MSGESSGLYDDIDEISRVVEVERLQEDLKGSHALIASLQSEVVDLKQQLEIILSEKNQLESNIVSVYNTALRELARRDKEIVELKTSLAAQLAGQTYFCDSIFITTYTTYFT